MILNQRHWQSLGGQHGKGVMVYLKGEFRNGNVKLHHNCLNAVLSIVHETLFHKARHT